MTLLLRLTFFISTLFSSFAWAEQVVLSGWGGLDRLNMSKILYQVAAPELIAAQIDVDYTALESNHNSFLLNRFSSGKAPDVFYLDVSDVTTLANLNLFFDFNKQAPELIKKIRPELTELFTVNGKVLGIAKDFNTVSVQFNKDIFTHYDVPFLNDSETFNEFRYTLEQLSKKLKPEGKIAACLDPDYASFAPFVLSTGWLPFDQNNKTHLDENFTKAFKFYVNLVRDGVAAVPNTIGHAWSSGCFTAGLSAVSVEGTWVSQHIQLNAPHLNYASVMPPIANSSAQPSNLIFAVAWAINKNSTQLTKSIKLVDILTGRNVQNFLYSQAIAIPASVMIDTSVSAQGNTGDRSLFETVNKIINNSTLHPYQFKRYGSLWMEPINKALRTAMLTNQPIDLILSQTQLAYDSLYEDTYQTRKH